MVYLLLFSTNFNLLFSSVSKISFSSKVLFCGSLYFFILFLRLIFAGFPFEFDVLFFIFFDDLLFNFSILSFDSSNF